MDIPLIGGVFSRTSDALSNTEIVILITPHIVKGGEGFEKTRGTIKGAKSYNESIQPNEPAPATAAGVESK